MFFVTIPCYFSKNQNVLFAEILTILPYKVCIQSSFWSHKTQVHI